MAEYDTLADEALTRHVSLPTNAAQLLVAQLDEALTERELLWRNVLSGTEYAMQDQPTPSLRHVRGITPDDGDGDDEHTLSNSHARTACWPRLYVIQARGQVCPHLTSFGQNISPTSRSSGAPMGDHTRTL